jgi:hypothetical protein
MLINPLLPSGFDMTGGNSTTYELPISGLGDWTGPSGGFYTLTILASTHGKGTSPSVQCYVSSGSDFESITPDSIILNSSGDVTISIPSSPDLRLLGKIAIK